MDGTLTDKTNERAANMERLFTTKRHADCKLLVGPEMVVIEAHKIILETSEFFRAALEPDRFREGFQNTIELPEDNPEDIERVLCYLYTGSYTPERIKWVDIPKKTWGQKMDLNAAYCHLNQYVMADRFFLHGLRKLAMGNIENVVPEDTYFWNLNLSPWVHEVYERTTPSSKDIRDLAMDWVLRAISGSANTNKNPGAIGEYITIPEFGEAFAKILCDGYLENKGQKAIYNV